MRFYLNELGCSDEGTTYFVNSYRTAEILVSHLSAIPAGHVPTSHDTRHFSDAWSDHDWYCLCWLFGYIYVYQSSSDKKCFKCIERGHFQEQLDKVVHQPDDRLPAFLASVNVTEGEYQFMHIHHGVHCKDGLFRLADTHLNTAIATKVPMDLRGMGSTHFHDTVMPELDQYRLAWAIGYLEPSGPRFVFRYIPESGSLRGCPFNKEALDYHCFREFCARLGYISYFDIHRVYCTYGSFDYPEFCAAVLDGPLGDLDTHDTMNIPMRHSIQQAVAWMEGSTRAYGVPLVNDYAVDEENPYLRFENLDVEMYDAWCRDNALDRARDFRSDQARRTAEPINPVVPLARASVPGLPKKRSLQHESRK